MGGLRVLVFCVWALGVSLSSAAFIVEPAHAGGPAEKVTICHIPPGNPSNSHTINIGQKGIDAHLAHGDPLESVGIGCAGGCVELCFDDNALCRDPAVLVCFGDLINDSLRLDDLDTDFAPDDGRAPAGVFTIDATFTNSSPDSFFDVFFEVAELTGGNLVLNADGGPGGVDSQVSVRGDVDSGDTFVQTFEIGLQEASPFRFFVDAFGTPN
jgi:hypothetical protein